MNENQLKVAQEIVDTEVNYVEKLGHLHLLFFKRAIALKELKLEVLSEKDIEHIFMNIEEIYKLNKNMCNALVQLRFKGDEELVKGISRILLQFTPFMKVYTTYTDKYSKAMELVKTLKKKTSVENFFKVGEICCGNEFFSLLILPVQRIPRYILLMKELLKVSKEDINTEINKKLHNTILELQKTATTINTNAKITEAREKVVSIQQKLFKNEINLVAPHRYVIAMGKMATIEKSTVFKKNFKYLYVLFNDIILWAESRKSGKSYKLVKVLPLEIVTITAVPQEHKNTNSFLISAKESGFKTIEVCSENQETRNSWVRMILSKKDEVIAENKRQKRKSLSTKELENTIKKRGEKFDNLANYGAMLKTSRTTDTKTESEDDIWTI